LQRRHVTPRECADLGEIGPLAERHRQPALYNGGEDLGCHAEVDLRRLASRPFHYLDADATLPRRFQHQPGHGGPMAGDLPIAPGPLTTTAKPESLLLPVPPYREG